MAYLTQTQQTNRPGAIAGVVAIHAGLGFLLISGLGVEIIERIDPGKIIAGNIPTEPPPPPPTPTPTSEPKTQAELPKSAPDPYIPPRPNTLPPTGPKIASAEKPNFGEVVPYVAPRTIKLPGPGTIPAATPLPSVDIVEAVGASPQGDRSRWVTQSDYRSRWIREEMTGTATFRLGIGVNGGVDSCSITKSSGHAQLDDATCALVTRRAKFNPARNTKGKPSTGSYTGTVLWQLPE